MRLKPYIAVILTLFYISGISQIKRPEAYLAYASFSTPSGQTYFETYLTVKGRTVNFGKGADSGYQCKVNVRVMFKQGDSTKATDNYNLLSKETSDTLHKLDFIGVRRYWLPKGHYTLYLKIDDKNNPISGSVSVNTNVDITNYKDSLSISDVEMISAYTQAAKPSPFTKSGYDMEPYVFNFYPQELNTLNFYVEVYNTMKVFGDSKFAVQYALENADTHARLNEFSHISVYSPDSVIPILSGFNIEKLPSGRYNLIVSVIDKNNKTLASRQFGLYRSNAVLTYAAVANKGGITNISGTFVARIKNKDTLFQDIKELYPIGNIDERNFINAISSKDDTSLMQRFFYNFWVTKRPSDPEGAWNEYRVQVNAVNKTFGTVNKKGYQTDRGRVYLQYGAPSQRDRETINPVSYPYEIWEYYKLADGETDKKFVFYEPSLATNDFVLLHSTARGEVQNRQWQMVIYGQTVTPYSVDQNNMDDPSGEDSQDQFSNPR